MRGFDELLGYLYHLDAIEDPCHPNYPPALTATVGPRNIVHSRATNIPFGLTHTRMHMEDSQHYHPPGAGLPRPWALPP